MDDPAFERFRVTAHGHMLEEPPAEVRERLLGILPTPARASLPPLREIIVELVQSLTGGVAVAGARGTGGSQQLLHRWPDGEVIWSVRDDVSGACRVIGQILADDASATNWDVSYVVDGATVASGIAEASGEFEFAVPAADEAAVHLHHDPITVVCGPVRIGA